VVEQRGLYYDGLQQGVCYKHAPGKTFDDAENTAFTAMTMNPASIHLDAHLSENNEFGSRLVNSLLTLSTLVGLSVGQLTQKTTVANLGFGKIEFPVRCSAATPSTPAPWCLKNGSLARGRTWAS
jgi:acyl dehydratase